MPAQKTPTLLIILVCAKRQQWFVAGAPMDEDSVDCLVRSEPGNLDGYMGQSPDEQLSFLRHRLSGAMQRGFDRLWGKDRKASRIVLIADEDLPESAPDLLPKLADHLDVWMSRPPITFFRGTGEGKFYDLAELDCLVGPLDADQANALAATLPQLQEKVAAADAWEVIPKPNA